MLLEPGVQRGRYHDRKPEFREFQSLFAVSGTKRGILELAHYRAELRQHSKPGNVAPDDWIAFCWKRVFVGLEDWLDGQPAVRVLESPDLAQVVVNYLFRFAREHYTLFAFVVILSHFHWLFQSLPGWGGATYPKMRPRLGLLAMGWSHSTGAASVPSRHLSQVRLRPDG